MSDISIAREDTPAGGRYIGHVAGNPDAAELVYTRPEPALVVAIRTFAPDSMRGSGVALALVERLVADARTDGFRIVPQCPYVKVQSRRHPEWADVIVPE
ncbi:MAG: GNAT family N-acetyltransferase [Ancalomicrobiaceae bacterium]|nr:GNAT family N-acetyltransferase [Ancalomicrobiaceae bacterium]